MNEVLPPEDGGQLTTIQDNNAALAVSLARVEIDHQISTAHAYPRNLTTVKKTVNDLVMLDEETAKECVYALPRAGKPIKGPSIRFAEILSATWGNCRVAARVVEVNRFEKYVEAEGIFHDLQSNTATTARVRRRIVDKYGKLYQDDMIIVTGNAACAIAKRNAIISGVPKAVWRSAYEQSERVIAGDIKTLSVRRDSALKAFAAFGVKPEQIFAVLEIPGADDVSLDDIVTLTAMYSSLKSGEETVESLFPKTGPVEKAGAKLADKLDRVAGIKDSEQVDTKTGEVTDKPAAAEKKAEPAKEAEKDAPKPRGRPPKAAEKAQEAPAQEKATDAAPKAEEAAQQAASPASVENSEDESAPFDADDADRDHVEEEQEAEDPLFDAGREAASNGTAALKKWVNRLSTKQYNHIGDRLQALQKFAAEIDKG